MEAVAEHCPPPVPPPGPRPLAPGPWQQAVCTLGATFPGVSGSPPASLGLSRPLVLGPGLPSAGTEARLPHRDSALRVLIHPEAPKRVKWGRGTHGQGGDCRGWGHVPNLKGTVPPGDRGPCFLIL